MNHKKCTFPNSNFFHCSIFIYLKLLLPFMNICRSESGLNQCEALSIEYPSHIDHPVKAKGKKKVKPTRKKQGLNKKDVNILNVPP
jgi:hypothetical protein